MELLQRKQNRLPNYDYNQNGAYFVTICTQDRKKILSTIVGDGFSVPNDNEKHNTTSGRRNASPTIGNVVGWYKYQVTALVNQRMGTPGARLLQRSYYDHVIRNQQDYNDIWEYIGNNPQKWLFRWVRVHCTAEQKRTAPEWMLFFFIGGDYGTRFAFCPGGAK